MLKVLKKDQLKEKMKIYLNGSKLGAEGELLVVVLQYSLNF